MNWRERRDIPWITGGLGFLLGFVLMGLARAIFGVAGDRVDARRAQESEGEI